MLPRTGGLRITNLYLFILMDGAHDVRDKPVGSPIAAPDDISCPGAGQQSLMGPAVIFEIKKRIAPATRDDFSAAFRGAVGIISAQRRRFPDNPRAIP